MQVSWLALESKYIESPRSFYTERLKLDIVRETEHEVTFGVGDSRLVLRAPHSVPRGGLHTHYAFSTGDYEAWLNRLQDLDPVEHDFGGSRSMYFYDPLGNCVEIGGRGDDGGLTGIFEVVLEVENLEHSLEFYTQIAEPYGNSGERRRVRLDAGGFDIELWEPHLGIADGQGGVHVDIGIGTDNASKTVENLEDTALSMEETNRGWRVKDPDGHYLTFI